MDAILITAEATEPPTLPLLHPPCEEESDRFYYGLPSRPRLVGRASAGIQIWETWAMQQDPRTRAPWRHAMKPKALGPIGDHAIRRCWASKVQPSILAAIDHLPWTSVDVFRIGYVDTPRPKRPVVVWVGVEHADMPWEDVACALRACRRALDAVQLADVDCQIRVSKIVSLVSSPSLLPPGTQGHDRPACVLPFTTAIGQSFFAFTMPGSQGSLGVYLGPATSDESDKDEETEESPPLWALTCRHVGLPTFLNPDNVHYDRRDEGNNTTLLMGLPSQTDTDGAMASLLAERNRLLHRFDANGSAPDEDKKRLLAQIEEAQALYETVRAFQYPEARETGTVLLAPPLGSGRHPLPWTRDWCLVELDRGKFPDGDGPTNVVDLLASPADPFLGRARRKPSHQMVSSPPDDGNGLLRIAGVIPLSEILDPLPGPTSHAQEDAGLVVGKCGAATGLTWGCPSELLSTVRFRFPDGHGAFVSQEWAIHGSLDEETVPFAAGGDSGAAVFDLDGRLGGFLTKGADANKNQQGRTVDITYATPAVLVLADVEEKLRMQVVLL